MNLCLSLTEIYYLEILKTFLCKIRQFIATKLDKKIIITIIKQELQFANILFDTKVHLCGIA